MCRQRRLTDGLCAFEAAGPVIIDNSLSSSASEAAMICGYLPGARALHSRTSHALSTSPTSFSHQEGSEKPSYVLITLS